MINVTINGMEIQAKEGQTILKAARENGIYIPTLCFLEGINEIGSCRICVVEIEGRAGLATACNTVVREGMKIQTDSEAVIEARKNTLHLLRVHCHTFSRNDMAKIINLSTTKPTLCLICHKTMLN